LSPGSDHDGIVARFSFQRLFKLPRSHYDRPVEAPKRNQRPIAASQAQLRHVTSRAHALVQREEAVAPIHEAITQLNELADQPTAESDAAAATAVEAAWTAILTFYRHAAGPAPPARKTGPSVI
jgi:hypothetical protein